MTNALPEQFTTDPLNLAIHPAESIKSRSMEFVFALKTLSESTESAQLVV